MRYIKNLEYELLKIVLQDTNMTYIHVPIPESYRMYLWTKLDTFSVSMRSNVFNRAVGDVVLHYWFRSCLDSTNSYSIMSIRCYVPCSDSHPRWSSIFRILSVELWLVLIISIMIAAISTTLVGRYSCTSEWQGYKTQTSSLT